MDDSAHPEPGSGQPGPPPQDRHARDDRREDARRDARQDGAPAKDRQPGDDGKQADADSPESPDQPSSQAEEPGGEGPDIPDAPGSDRFRSWDQAVRKQRNAARQRLKDHAQGVQATMRSQASMYGHAVGTIIADAVTFGSVSPSTGVRKGAFQAERLTRLRQCFLETDAYRELIARLPHNPVQILHGLRGSGRTATAVLALEQAVHNRTGDDTPDSSLVWALHHDTKPGDITTEDLEEGCAYLLDRSSTIQEDRLDAVELYQLRARAAEAGALVVIVLDDPIPDRAALDGYLVGQRAPDPQQVLQKHLDELPTGSQMPWNDSLREAAESVLALAPAPHAVAEVASNLAVLANAEASPEELSSWLVARLGEEVRRKLAEPGNPKGPDDKKPDLATAEAHRRRALLLTCAILDGLPLATVIDQATDLTRRLHAQQDPDNSLPLPVFGSEIEHLLDYAGTLTQHAEPSDTDDGDDPAPRVRMRPLVPAAVLEAAWCHYDTVRVPLLEWLGTLVTQGDDATRVCAAAAVGKLASYDPEHVCARLVDNWAASPDSALRWAAAWALELTASQDGMGPLVRDRILRWCRERWGKPQQTRNRQRTALMAFTTTIGSRNVHHTLEALSLLAARHEHSKDYALACGVRELFLAGFHTEVRELLTKWTAEATETGNRAPRLQAVRSLLVISDDAANPDGDHPDILIRFAHDAEWRDTATNLWGLALTDAATTKAAWDVLWQWLHRAGGDAELAEPVEELAATLFHGSSIRTRARFYQRLWRSQPARRDAGVDRILTRVLGTGASTKGPRSWQPSSPPQP